MLSSALTKMEKIAAEVNGRIGWLGEIYFSISSIKVQTVSKAVWSGSARYSTHKRHLTHALTEFTGLEPDTFSFDMVLHDGFGVRPMDLLVKLWRYEREGLPQPLVIGDHAYGKYKWLVQRHSTKMEYYDKEGVLIYAVVSVELLEYLRK